MGSQFTTYLNPMKGPSQQETTQHFLTKLPTGHGLFVGSLGSHGEKGFLHNCLRLQEAIVASFIMLLFLNRLPFPYVPIFFRPLTLRVKHTSSDETVRLRGTPLKEMVSVHGFADALS